MTKLDQIQEAMRASLDGTFVRQDGLSGEFKQVKVGSEFVPNLRLYENSQISGANREAGRDRKYKAKHHIWTEYETATLVRMLGEGKTIKACAYELGIDVGLVKYKSQKIRGII